MRFIEPGRFDEKTIDPAHPPDPARLHEMLGPHLLRRLKVSRHHTCGSSGLGSPLL